MEYAHTVSGARSPFGRLLFALANDSANCAHNRSRVWYLWATGHASSRQTLSSFLFRETAMRHGFLILLAEFRRIGGLYLGIFRDYGERVINARANNRVKEKLSKKQVYRSIAYDYS